MYDSELKLVLDTEVLHRHIIFHIHRRRPAERPILLAGHTRGMTHKL